MIGCRQVGLADGFIGFGAQLVGALVARVQFDRLAQNRHRILELLALDEHLRTYLFTTGDVLAIEDAATASGEAGPPGSLGIGSLKAEVVR